MQGGSAPATSSRPGDQALPSHCTEKLGGKRLGTGQGREEMSTSGAGGDQKPGFMGLFQNAAKRAKQARLNLM